VTLCGGYWSDTFYCNPDEYDPLPKAALRSLDFQERLDLLHDAERIVLRDLPYLILVHDAVIQVTRTDTWTGYRPSPESNGYPFSTSWLQLQLIEPGSAASASYAGASIVILGFAAAVAIVVALSRWRRRREEMGPLELAPEDGPRIPAGVGGRTA
jgi:hypothetical protein